MIITQTKPITIRLAFSKAKGSYKKHSKEVFETLKSFAQYLGVPVFLGLSVFGLAKLLSFLLLSITI